MSGWNGGGRILVSQSAEELKEEKRAGTSADYKKLGSGIFMSLVIYLLGDILGKLPGTSVIAGLAWSIIIAIVIKCTGILSDDIADNCVYSMNFALKALCLCWLQELHQFLKDHRPDQVFQPWCLCRYLLWRPGCFYRCHDICQTGGAVPLRSRCNCRSLLL